MKLLYFSCHSILEYDEVKLFHELGYDVFSCGVYANPQGHESLPRGPIPGLKHYPEMERLASTIRVGGGHIPQELIDWADVIVFMHEPVILASNWMRMKHKKVIFRSIGQMVKWQEELLQKLTPEGLKIVRYSPAEKNIPGFSGQDTLIRFYKDPEEYTGYTGEIPQAINVVQNINNRKEFCSYDVLQQVLQAVPNKIYGLNNEGLGNQWGGKLTEEGLREVLRKSRVYMYTGTWPACYTLSFIEALMTGIPVVSIGHRIAEDKLEHFAYFEVPEILINGHNGFSSDDIYALKDFVKLMIDQPEEAKQIGQNGRHTAIELFGKENIGKQWKEFIDHV